jgi:histone-lysine N-methyltransferase MLL1
VLKSVNNILDQHQRTRQLRNSTAKRLLQRAKSNGSNTRNLLVQSGEKPSTVRKFVLPVRSVHSSRVIKPNKRFIEELEEISVTEHSENEIGTHVKRARLNLDKFDNQESKLKSDTVKLCMKFKDKELRNKSRKVIQDVGTNAEVTQQAKNTEKSANSVQNAQISKNTHREVNKSHTISCKTKISNSSSINSSNNQEFPQNSSRVAQTAKSTVPRNHKQISIPITKVLPDSNVPNFESSRVQTRSGTQNEVASDLNNQATFENGAGLTEDDAKTEDQLENSNKTVVSALDNFEAESNLSESETESEHSNHTENEQSEFSGMKLNGGKVILRKARLKLDNKCLAGTEGPFSTTSTSNTMGGNTSLGTCLIYFTINLVYICIYFLSSSFDYSCNDIWHKCVKLSESFN